MPQTCPKHWLTYVGESGWYTLRYPPTWTVKRCGPSVEILPPHRKAKVFLQCIKLSPHEGVEEVPEVPIEKMLPQGPGVRPLAPPTVPWRCVAAEGNAAALQTANHNPDLLEGGKWSRWQAWVMEHHLVVLAVSYLQRGARDPEGESLARLIVGSICLADKPPDGYEEFAKRLADRARELYPDVRVELNEDQSIQFGDAIMSPYNLFRQYVQDASRFEAVADRALRTAFELQEESHVVRRIPGFEEVRDRILPVPFPRRMWERELKHLVGENWVADLAILYAVDEEKVFWYLTRGHLKTWQVGFEEVQRLARQNLDAYFDRHPGTFVTGPEGGIAMPAERDSYNASRLLSPKFRQQLQQLLGPQFVIGVPQRDFFIAFQETDADLMKRIKQQVAHDFDRAEHALTKRLLFVSPDGVSEYV